MRAFLAVLGTIFAVAYPAAVYFGLTHFGTRQVTLLLASLIAAGALLKLPSAGRAHALAALKVPALLLPLFALSFVLDDARFLFAMPVLINVILLASFARSLHTELPIVERFARLQVRDLSDAEVRYCRTVTEVWCVFFAANGLTALLLAWLAPLGWWASYTGGIAYVLIGVIGATEYLIRKSRFGRFGTGPLDRMLQSVLPRSKMSS